jgi:hypothetical protein
LTQSFEFVQAEQTPDVFPGAMTQVGIVVLAQSVSDVHVGMQLPVGLHMCPAAQSLSTAH